jgi:DNA-binding MurR/RpiR family transcriptional regulator
MPQSDLFAVLNAQRGALSRSEQSIASLLTEDTDFALNASIAELAARSEVSPPTVTRFCRRLGCASYADFKMQLAQAAFTGTRYIRPSVNGVRPDHAESVFNAATNALRNIHSSLDRDRVEAAAKALAQAGNIAAFGSGGNSAMIATEIQNRLFRLGLRVTASADHSFQLMQSAVLGPGDVVIGSSLSGRNAELVKAFVAARTYGATIIAITRSASPVAVAADIHLAVDIDEGDNILMPTPARYGFLLMVDIIAHRVAQLREGAARETLRRIKFQLANERDANDREVLGD